MFIAWSSSAKPIRQYHNPFQGLAKFSSGRSRLGTRGPPADGLADGAVDPGGQEDDEDNEQQAVDGVSHPEEPEAEGDAESLGERRRQRGAHQRAHQRVHAAEHHGEDDLQRHADARERVRVDVGHVLGVEDAAERGEACGDHRDAELEAGDADPHRGRRRLVFADSLERRPRHAPVHEVPHREAGEEKHQRGIVEHALVRELQRPQSRGRARGLETRAERAPRPVALGDDEEADDLAHGQRDQGEVVTDDAKPEAGDAEHDCDPDRRRHREEGAVAEGDEPEAPHEGPRLADEGPDEDLDGHVEHVLLHAAHGEEGGDEEEGEDGQREKAAARHSRFARMPPGRTNIMTMKMTKAITYPISVEMTTPPMAMISLMMKDAMKAPTMLPRPPSTQIMNVRGPNCPPKKGWTEYWKMSRA